MSDIADHCRLQISSDCCKLSFPDVLMMTEILCCYRTKPLLLDYIKLFQTIQHTLKNAGLKITQVGSNMDKLSDWVVLTQLLG